MTLEKILYVAIATTTLIIYYLVCGLSPIVVRSSLMNNNFVGLLLN